MNGSDSITTSLNMCDDDTSLLHIQMNGEFVCRLSPNYKAKNILINLIINPLQIFI